MIKVNGKQIGVESKKVVSYLPDHNYLNDWMKVKDLVSFFDDCYEDFDPRLAYRLLSDLKIDEKQSLKSLSKGNKEKVQLILVMSRNAQLYLLDEPIAGVDPAARDYILRTIMQNYNRNATVLISTHLIADVETILDEVIFLKDGAIVLHEDKAKLVDEKGMSVDALFREVFKC
jgi:ABC-2 type transport system ATP-binding protein